MEGELGEGAGGCLCCKCGNIACSHGFGEAARKKQERHLIRLGDLDPSLAKYQMEWESGALLVKLGRLTSTHSVNIPCWSFWE